MKLNGNYKGFKIEYLDHIKEFRLLDDGEFEYMNKDLDKVTSYVDRKLKQKFDRINAFYLKGDYTPVFVEITGVAGDSGAWITEKEKLKDKLGDSTRKKRSKHHGTLYFDTEYNREMLYAIKEKYLLELKIRNDKIGLLEQMREFEAIK